MPFSSLMHSKCNSCSAHRVLTALLLLEHHASSERAGDLEELSKWFFDTLFTDSDMRVRYKDKSHSDRLKYSLQYLREGGMFSTPSGSVKEAIDCPRFFLYLLDPFSNFSSETLGCDEKCRWETYASFIEKAHKLLMPRIDYNTFIAKALSPVREQFTNQHLWRTRTALIRGLRNITYEVFELHPAYWACCEQQLKYCCVAASCFEKGSIPKSLKEAACEVIDLWKQISVAGEETIESLQEKLRTQNLRRVEITDINRQIEAVRKSVETKVVGHALSLIWLVDHCQLPLNLGIDRYTQMLRALKLPSISCVARLLGKKVPRDEGTEQMLTRVFTDHVFRMYNDRNNVHYMNRTIEDSLMPYLLGQARKSDRRYIDEDDLSQVSLSFGLKPEPVKVRLADICGKTAQAFRIVTDKLKVQNAHRVDFPVRRKTLDRIRLLCNNTYVQPKQAILDIPYVTKGEKHLIYRAECEIVSIDKEQDRRLSVVFFAPKKRSGEWPKYVARLPRAQVYVR